MSIDTSIDNTYVQLTGVIVLYREASPSYTLVRGQKSRCSIIQVSICRVRRRRVQLYKWKRSVLRRLFREGCHRMEERYAGDSKRWEACRGGVSSTLRYRANAIESEVGRKSRDIYQNILRGRLLRETHRVRLTMRNKRYVTTPLRHWRIGYVHWLLGMASDLHWTRVVQRHSVSVRLVYRWCARGEVQSTRDNVVFISLHCINRLRSKWHHTTDGSRSSVGSGENKWVQEIS